MQFSLITPVYKCSAETHDYLESLTHQNYDDFEIIIVEDGKQDSSKAVIDKFSDKLKIRYYFKENTSVSFRRNFAMLVAKGDFFVFFDSDCIIPPDYLKTVTKAIKKDKLDAWGGPDNAHASFSNFQKAVNYSMTSFFTTGGIRGGKKKVDKFYPRSFNMGVCKDAFETTKGFPVGISPGEDIIFSIKIIDAGYKTRLISDAFVYHKRKVNPKKYFKQILSFAKVRVPISIVYPHTFSIVFLFPLIYVMGFIFLVLLSAIISPLLLIPIIIHYIAIFIDSLLKNKSFVVAALSVYSSLIQFFAYGLGFLSSLFKMIIVGKEKYLEKINYSKLL